MSSPVLWHLEGVKGEDLVSFQYITHSQLTNSTTLIIDTETLQLHPHFSEFDHLEENDLDARILYSIPATALKFNSTYVVVVKGIEILCFQ